MTLLADLTQAAEPALPKGFTPGIKYSGREVQEITTPWTNEILETEEDFRRVALDMGVPLPEHLTLELVEARFNQAAWHRDAGDRGTKNSAYTAPMWLYRFKVVPRSLRADGDLAKMAVEARKAARSWRPRTRVAESDSKVISLADFQIGKTDFLGGTAETLERSEVALKQILADIRREKPAEIILADLGDSTEGFESAPNAARTNDLHQTEQIRVWRRIFWRWIKALAALGIPMRVVSVPSNHCRGRSGKATLGHALDDWGIEVLSQVSDIAAESPEAFGHVTFHMPAEHTEFVVLELVGGKRIGFVHGHQVGSPDRLAAWVKGLGGKHPLSSCDVVVAGHFHHDRRQAFGDGQVLYISPTNDPGSSWFYNISGENSRTAVLTLVVDDFAATDRIIWTS